MLIFREKNFAKFPGGANTVGKILRRGRKGANIANRRFITPPVAKNIPNKPVAIKNEGKKITSKISPFIPKPATTPTFNTNLGGSSTYTSIINRPQTRKINISSIKNRKRRLTSVAPNNPATTPTFNTNLGGSSTYNSVVSIPQNQGVFPALQTGRFTPTVGIGKSIKPTSVKLDVPNQVNNYSGYSLPNIPTTPTFNTNLGGSSTYTSVINRPQTRKINVSSIKNRKRRLTSVAPNNPSHNITTNLNSNNVLDLKNTYTKFGSTLSKINTPKVNPTAPKVNTPIYTTDRGIGIANDSIYKNIKRVGYKPKGGTNGAASYYKVEGNVVRDKNLGNKKRLDVTGVNEISGQGGYNNIVNDPSDLTKYKHRTGKKNNTNNTATTNTNTSKENGNSFYEKNKLLIGGAAGGLLGYGAGSYVHRKDDD